MIWLGTAALLVIVVCIFFLPTLLRSIHINVGYWAWRLFGGVKSLSEGKKLWEACGLPNPYLLTVDQKSNFLMSISGGVIDKGVEYINLGDDLSLLSEISNTEGNMRKIDVTFENVFAIKPKNVKIGCHGAYSLPKAAYLLSKFGGDPVCGGGLKYYSASFLKTATETRRLRNKLKNRRLQVFAKVFENGASGVIYHNSTPTPRGFLELLLGEENLVREYAKRTGVAVKPVQVEFV